MQLPANALGKAADDGSTPGAPATYGGDLCGCLYLLLSQVDLGNW